MNAITCLRNITNIYKTIVYPLQIFINFVKILFMIQRIQSIYLFIAAIISLLLFWFFPLFNTQSGAIELIDEPIFFTAYVFSGIISLFTIFRYKNRKQQVVSGRINIIVNFIAFSFILYYFFTALKSDAQNQLGVTAFLPIITVVFISMANRAIMKDESLVRSADRFR